MTPNAFEIGEGSDHMKQKLKEYVDVIFADAERRSPANPQLAELKEEMLHDLWEKYDDLVASGKSPESAYHLAVTGIGDITDLLDAVTGTASEAAPAPAAPAHESEKRGAETNGKIGTDTVTDKGQDDESGKRPRRSRRCALVCGILWTLTVCAYPVVSFVTGAWNVTWIMFLMAIAADNVVEGIFDLRR